MIIKWRLLEVHWPHTTSWCLAEG